MEWTEKQILDTLKLIEASDYDEVKLEVGDFKLHVRKRGAPAAEAVTPTLPAAQPVRAAPAPQPAVAPSPSPAPPPSSASSAPAEALPPGCVAIRAPMVGTFYRAPAPHAPPFVEAGAQVAAGDTVCLIEVMKLFNTIKAGVAGRVVKILAQNAATVKKDEVLFWIAPGER
jgi:acetyl-CoA carboxylase biotin carboxyl carrier protein